MIQAIQLPPLIRSELDDQMNALDSDLLTMLAYRLRAISIGRLALQHHMSWDEIPTMQVYFDGEQVMEGNACGFTNAAIESSIIHGRAILEFLGLMASKNSTSQVTQGSSRPRADDRSIEHFAHLSMLTREKAIAAFPSDERSEAEAALALIFFLANKGLAHTTMSFKLYSIEARRLSIAFLGAQRLLVDEFYIPLGLPAPSYELDSRSRNGA